MSREASLRPARAIYNQIRWDPRIEAGEFVVGVEDRFAGIREYDSAAFVPGFTPMGLSRFLCRPGEPEPAPDFPVMTHLWF